MDIKIAQQETITELVLENQKLKQERDEARKDAAQLADRLSGLELRTTEELAKLERERNEWAAMCGRYKQERDEARKNWGDESMNAAQFFGEKTKAIAERDEARKHLRDANRGAEINAHINQKFAQQLIDAREKIKNQAERIRVLEGATNHACGTPLTRALRERDEAREQNAKLRDIADMAIIPLECDGVPWGAKLRAELDQLKEGAK